MGPSERQEGQLGTEKGMGVGRARRPTEKTLTLGSWGMGEEDESTRGLCSHRGETPQSEAAS